MGSLARDQWEGVKTTGEARLHIKGFIAGRKELPPGAFWLPWTKVQAPVAKEPDVVPGDLLVHYTGEDYMYGIDVAGHGVEVHRKTFKVKRIYTNGQRREAVERHARGESYAQIAKDFDT